jgi:uracil-DNA glycosylase family 4
VSDQFVSLLEDVVVEKPTAELKVIQPKPKRNTKKLGCENCELNEVEKRFITKVHGRPLMIIGGAPTEEEEDSGRLFKSRSGNWLWQQLYQVGIKCEDCDTQVALRCTPEYGIYLNDKTLRHPLKCCSVHTEAALEKSAAKVYLIFGIESAQQVLGKEYRKGTTILWSDKLNARVYCLHAPSYVSRSNVNPKILREFKTCLKLIATDLKTKKLSKFQYIDQQDYRGIVTGSAARAEVVRIKEFLAKHPKVKLRVYCDEEAGRNKKGEWKTLCIGTCVRPGRVRVFVTHPKYIDKQNRLEIIAALQDLLEDENIEKSFHHGSYDVPSIEKRLGIRVDPFRFDTNYSTYLADPDFKPSFGLDVVGLRHFPKFGEYKTITLPEAMPRDFDLKEHRMTKATRTQLHDYLSSRGLLNLYNLPLEKLIRYNGADCDLGKHLELMTEKKVSLPLLSIYTDVAFTLDAMVANGPYFDYDQHKILRTILPPKIKMLHRRIAKAAGKKDFNPKSHPQIKWLLYKKLKLKPPPLTPKERRAGKSAYKTDKNALEVMGRTNSTCRDIQEYRRYSKMESTYLDSYGVCADYNKGRLATKWWLTGTRTGRLSSGGEKGKKKEAIVKVVNLQNVHGDQDVQNMLVPDARWRELYTAVKKAIASTIGDVLYKKLQIIARDETKVKELEELEERLYEMLADSKSFQKQIRIILRRFGDICVVMGFDQGQIEIRVLAQASGDQNLINDCQSGDIHSKVGHTMTGWAVEKIRHDKKTRTLTKNCHFGLVYGISEDGLLTFILIKDPTSTVTQSQINKMMGNYFRRYRKVKQFIEKQRADAEKYKIVKNMFGFVRPLDFGYAKEDEADTHGGGAFWGNIAINTPIQGAAHHLMLMAMSLLKNKDNKYRIMLGVPGMEVHDYLGWWTPLKKLEKSLVLAKALLEKEPLKMVKKLYPKINWRVPLKVEAKCGFRFGDTVEVEGLSLPQMLAKMFFETFKSDQKLGVKYHAMLRKAEKHAL